jgi:hypothetical protein
VPAEGCSNRNDYLAIAKQAKELGSHHDKGGAGVLQNFGNLGCCEPPVQGHRNGTKAGSAEQYLEELDRVAAQERQAAPASDTGLRHCVQQPGQYASIAR